MNGREAVFETIKRNLLTVVPEIDAGAVVPERTMAELGCNSIDRTEVVMLTMEQLGLTIPVTEFLSVEDLGSLTDLLRKHL